MKQNNSKKFPIGLWQHWRKCPYDDCSMCYDYTKWIHAWQRRTTDFDKIIKRTVDDIGRPREK